MDDPDFAYDVRVTPMRRSYSFSMREVKELAISALVLSAAFTIARMDVLSNGFDWALFILFFPIAVLTITVGFILHELSHKFVAQKYGAWSEYRMSMQGLIFALITAFFGIVFAAPGAVMVAGYLTKEENGKVSVAGPVMNLFLAFTFLGLATAALFLGHPVVASLLGFAFSINAFLAAFNMIPIYPLDGSKVWKWSVPVYLGVAGVALVLLLFSWGVF